MTKYRTAKGASCCVKIVVRVWYEIKMDTVVYTMVQFVYCGAHPGAVDTVG